MNLLLAAVLLLQDRSAEQLIEALRSDKVEEREHAALELLKKGSSAVPALRKASADADIEFSGRAKQILENIGSANAKAAFGKIEEVIRNSKTLRIRFKSEASNRGPNMPESERSVIATGSLLLKAGNKLLQEVQMVKGGDTSSFSIISDGAHVVSRRGERSHVTVEAPKDLNRCASSVIAIMGAAIPWQIEDGKVEPFEFTKGCKITDFREVPFEGATKALSFKVAEEKVSAIAELKMTLWYESDSYRLLRRTMDVKFKDTSFESSATVTYLEFTLNGDIPDEKFKLPEEKK